MCLRRMPQALPPSRTASSRQSANVGCLRSRRVHRGRVCFACSILSTVATLGAIGIATRSTVQPDLVDRPALVAGAAQTISSAMAARLPGANHPRSGRWLMLKTIKYAARCWISSARIVRAGGSRKSRKKLDSRRRPLTTGLELGGCRVLASPSRDSMRSTGRSSTLLR